MTRLEYFRRERGLTLTALGREVGVPHSILSDVERGKRQPYPRLRRELARALGIPADVLFGDTPAGHRVSDTPQPVATGTE